MVQRKLQNNLSIQVDHIKTKNQFSTLKSSPLHHQDHVKKMKKSGSIKRPELGSPRYPHPRRHVKQPGKPPPAGLTTPPRKQPPAGPMAATPNYMKSTTSSNARKEVSTKSPQTSSTSPRKSSKFTLASGNKATRTTSMKMMRTLTKNPSFKPARPKKCSRVVLCDNLDARRATCSSTLKDSKFPAYVELNHGGTELEGTSTIKVCPYTYCSLNGHHRDHLPPLKCFLSARRRTIKNQRSIKLGCLSPRRVKANGDGLNEKSGVQDDFFIEIYAKGNDNDEERVNVTDEKTAEDQEEERIWNEPLSDGSICNDVDTHETVDSADMDKKCFSEQTEEMKVAENFYVSSPSAVEEDESICNDVDTHETVDSAEMEEKCFSEQNEETKVAEDVFVSSPSPVEEEEKTGFLSGADSEASDMDWDTGFYSTLYLDYYGDDAYEYSAKTEMQPDQEGGVIENPVIHDEFAIKYDDKGGYFNELSEDEVSQESFDDDSLSSDAFSSSSDSESTGSYDYPESLNNLKASESVEIPPEKPEPEPAHNDANELLYEAKIPNQEEVDKDCNQDQEKEPRSEVPELINPTESNQHTVQKSKGENAAKEETEDSSLIQAIVKCKKKPIQETDESGNGFNPREPNFLPLEPDPEAEKVDLRHQELDERKNAEEWMVDYALRQTVTKLAPARKRKVALLVEAFEKVMPVAKTYELHLKHASGFDHTRPIQACN